MELLLEDDRSAAWTVVRVSGELDLHTAPRLRDHVLTVVGEADAGTRVALDLTGVGFLDSSGLGSLVTCLKRVREAGGRLVLVGVSGSPMKVFSLTGLDRVFEIVDTTADLPAA
jgi:anti-sigma B factor antagonist